MSSRDCVVSSPLQPRAVEGLSPQPVTGGFPHLVGLVVRTKPISWFLRCFFILGFSFEFPWCVPAPEGRVNGGSVTCLLQLLFFFSPSFSSFYPSSIGRMILTEGTFFFPPSLSTFLLFHMVLIFSVTQAWICLSFVLSFIPSSLSFSGRLSHPHLLAPPQFQFLALNLNCWLVSQALCPHWSQKGYP